MRAHLVRGYMRSDNLQLPFQTSAMVNFQSDAMSMVHFSTALRYQLFLEKLNIAIVAIIFLDHQERLFFDYFAHFRTDFLGLFLTCSAGITSFLMIPVSHSSQSVTHPSQSGIPVSITDLKSSKYYCIIFDNLQEGKKEVNSSCQLEIISTLNSVVNST